MKKSELRALIREVLKEELLREENETIIDEKGFLSAASRVISDKLNGKTLVDKETGDTVATVPSLNNLSRFTTKVADGKEYSYFLAKDVPTTTKLSDELLTALRELAKLWAKRSSEEKRMSFDTRCSTAKTPNGKMNVIFTLKVMPNSGYTIK